MKTLYKRLKTDGHFRDFFHRASSLKNDKRIQAKMDRRRVSQFAKEFMSDEVHETAKMFRRSK